MKKPHNKAYLVIAGLALLAFVLTYALFSGVVAPKPVVVAKADMAAGTRLTADLLELRTLPGAAVPKGAYSSLDGGRRQGAHDRPRRRRHDHRLCGRGEHGCERHPGPA